MQRSTLAAVLSLSLLTLAPGCDKGANDAKGSADAAKADGGDVKADGSAEPEAAEAGQAPAADTDTAPEADTAPAADTAPEADTAPAAADTEVAADTEAADTTPAADEAGEEDPVPGLFEIVKSLDNDDDAANKALEDALAAGAAKLDAAKAAEERGEALMTKGESERAEAFFKWAMDAHTKYADPVYNLAKLAAYAGDLDLAKEHLVELQKRGNKKLMKKVGIEPAFAPLHDDPDVRKIYEQ